MTEGPGLDVVEASRKGDIRRLRQLLAKGAPADAKGPDGFTALHLAATAGHTIVVRTLLNRKIPANEQAPDGTTALINAAENGHAEVVAALLAKGANPRTTDQRGFTCLMIAAERSHAAVVGAILSRKGRVDPNCKYPSGTPLIIHAIHKGQAGVVAALVKGGVDPNSITNPKEGMTLLQLAAKCAQGKVITALCKNGATVDAQDERGDTALHKAVHYWRDSRQLASGKSDAKTEQYAAAVKALLDAGADPWKFNYAGKTALTMASDKGFKEAKQLMMKAVPNIRSTEKYKKAELSRQASEAALVAEMKKKKEAAASRQASLASQLSGGINSNVVRMNSSEVVATAASNSRRGSPTNTSPRATLSPATPRAASGSSAADASPFSGASYTIHSIDLSPPIQQQLSPLASSQAAPTSRFQRSGSSCSSALTDSSAADGGSRRGSASSGMLATPSTPRGAKNGGLFSYRSVSSAESDMPSPLAAAGSSYSYSPAGSASLDRRDSLDLAASLNRVPSLDFAASLEQSTSLERSGSLDLAASLGRAPSLDFAASLGNSAGSPIQSAALDRRDSLDLAGSLDRAPSLDLGASLNRTASLDLFASLERSASQHSIASTSSSFAAYANDAPPRAPCDSGPASPRVTADAVATSSTAFGSTNVGVTLSRSSSLSSLSSVGYGGYVATTKTRRFTLPTTTIPPPQPAAGAQPPQPATASCDSPRSPAGSSGGGGGSFLTGESSDSLDPAPLSAAIAVEPSESDEAAAEQREGSDLGLSGGSETSAAELAAERAAELEADVSDQESDVAQQEEEGGSDWNKPAAQRDPWLSSDDEEEQRDSWLTAAKKDEEPAAAQDDEEDRLKAPGAAAKPLSLSDSDDEWLASPRGQGPAPAEEEGSESDWAPKAAAGDAGSEFDWGPKAVAEDAGSESDWGPKAAADEDTDSEWRPKAAKKELTLSDTEDEDDDWMALRRAAPVVAKVEEEEKEEEYGSVAAAAVEEKEEEESDDGLAGEDKGLDWGAAAKAEQKWSAASSDDDEEHKLAAVAEANEEKEGDYSLPSVAEEDEEVEEQQHRLAAVKEEEEEEEALAAETKHPEPIAELSCDSPIQATYEGPASVASDDDDEPAGDAMPAPFARRLPSAYMPQPPVAPPQKGCGCTIM